MFWADGIRQAVMAWVETWGAGIGAGFLAIVVASLWR